MSVIYTFVNHKSGHCEEPADSAGDEAIPDFNASMNGIASSLHFATLNSTPRNDTWATLAMTDK